MSRPPDFLGIGAQKAGTTWLWKNLATHPDVWFPEGIKEFHYFNDRAELATQTWRRKLRGDRLADQRWRRRIRRRIGERRRAKTLRGVGWEARFFFRRPTDAWYLDLFDPAGDRLTGDITPDYLRVDSATIAAAARLAPDAKIILLMRNPVERVWSSAAFFRGRMQGRDPADLGRDEVRRMFRNPHNRRLTEYLGGLKRWREHFEADAFFLGFTEDIAFRPAEFLDRMHQFLGLDPVTDHPAAQDQVNWMGSRIMPGWAASDIAHLHRGVIDRLAARFGGHADWWAFAARALREEATLAAGDLDYPMYAGPLWPRWVARVAPEADPADWRPPLQSGPLSTLIHDGGERFPEG